MAQRKEYFNYAVYVKRHIINEDDDYRTDYNFLYCNIEKTSTETISEHLGKTGIPKRMGINGTYSICLDLNEHHFVSENCIMSDILSSDTLTSLCHVPHGGTKSVLYIQLVPDEEHWVKYIALDDAQIEEAKKIMSDIDKQPFKRRKKNQ